MSPVHGWCHKTPSGARAMRRLSHIPGDMTVPKASPASLSAPETCTIQSSPGKAGISGLHSRLPRGVRPRLEGKPRSFPHALPLISPEALATGKGHQAEK